MKNKCDVCVVGGGSGGFGAALAAARRGLRVLLVEKGSMLGGTSTLGGVNTWEPGVSSSGFPLELYERLRRQQNAIGVSRTIQNWQPDKPWGWSRVDALADYQSSERRAGTPSDQWARITFEPEAMAAEMLAMLQETGNVDVRLNTRFVRAECQGDQVKRLWLSDSSGEFEIEPSYVVDSTAELLVASAVGCRTSIGTEPKSMYGEDCAPIEPLTQINGVTLCFRVTPSDVPNVQPLPPELSGGTFTPPVSITEYPCGDLNMNSLPTLDGWEYRQLGEVEGRRICEQRIALLWHWLQADKGFDRYRLVRLFPMVGVREGARLVGRHVLTELEVRAGCSGQQNRDRWIALADHALDVHGHGHMCRELSQPYGVPYECLLPQEFENLIVACRGASFSHIAASSCRLSRTMMALGHATGLAVAEAVKKRTGLSSIEVGRIQPELNVLCDAAV